MTLQLQFHLFRSKLSFRTFHDLDLKGAIEVRFFHRHMFYCRRKVRYFNSLKFQFQELRK